MQARTDLLHVAERLAGGALEAAQPHESKHSAVPALPADLEQAARLAHGAQAALQAASLVDIEPAPIIAALEELTTKLGLADVDAVLNLNGPAEAIQATSDLLEHYIREVRVAAAVQHGYIALRDLVHGLERDFSQADTPVAKRIAARIHTGLEDAENAIQAARTQ